MLIFHIKRSFTVRGSKIARTPDDADGGVLEVRLLPTEAPPTSRCESEEYRTLRTPAPGPGLLAALDGSSALDETDCMQKLAN